MTSQYPAADRYPEHRATGVLLIGIGLLLAAPPLLAENATVPGELLVDSPTIRCLSFRWLISGDDNGNAGVAVAYRRKGEEEWLRALPFLRVNRETVDRDHSPFTCGNLLAGSILYLQPGATYEVRLILSDPDGGQAERTVTSSTRPIPAVLEGDRQVHVYPEGHKGEKLQPAFPSLKDAFRKARPGDVVLIHAGTYQGTYGVAVRGTPGKPIVFRAADGEAVLDGGGVNGNIIDAQGGKDHLYFEGLTIRNGRTAIKANGSSGLVVRRCRMEKVGYGVVSYTSNTSGWYIADNTIIGQIEQWYPRRDVGMNTGVNVIGNGHVVCHNRISGFWDCISTFNGSGKPQSQWNTARHPPQMSIDIHNNDLSEAVDDGLEADHGLHNVRVFENRIMNACTGISTQPNLAGPVYLIRNLVFNAGTPWKLHNYPTGLIILHNTSIGCGQALVSWPPSWQNAFIRNNLFLGSKRYAVETGSPHPLTSLDYNGYRKTGDPSRFIKWTRDGGKTWQNYATLQDYHKGAGHEEHGAMVSFGTFEKAFPPQEGKTYAAETIDLRPRPTSRAEDAGLVLPNINDAFSGKAPDLGAHELGSPPLHFGPRPVEEAE